MKGSLRTALVAAGVLVAVFFGQGVWRSWAYRVHYGIGPQTFHDGLLYRPLDVRLTPRIWTKAGSLFCIKVPQNSLRWLVVDFDSRMVYSPNGWPDQVGLNQTLGVALTDSKMELGWQVEFSGDRVLCYSAAGDWCLLTR